MDSHHSPPLKRWRLAILLGFGGLLLGVLDTWILMALGLEFSLSGSSGTAFIGGFLAISFAIFGALLGLAIRARQRERRHASVRQESLMRLAEVQGRLGQLEKMASLGQMVASIAHEVRNPLAIIRTHIQNLAEDRETGMEQRPEDFEIVLAEIDRLARVVEGISHFARPLQPKPANVATRDIVSRLEFLTSTLYQSRRVLRMEHRLEGAPDSLTTDPDLVCQAILVLVVNAVEANPPHAAVSLELSCEDRQIAFTVNDTGPGIPEPQLQRVFDPFFTTKPDGNGLGLSISRQIAEALGGGLKLVNRPNGGLSASLLLPLDA